MKPKSYNDRTAEKLNLTMQIESFRSPLLCREILSFNFAIDYAISTTSGKTGLHYLPRENISNKHNKYSKTRPTLPTWRNYNAPVDLNCVPVA